MFDVTNSIVQAYGLRSRQHAEVIAADGLARGHLPTLLAATSDIQAFFQNPALGILTLR
jgi:hypothetical protein